MLWRVEFIEWYDGYFTIHSSIPRISLLKFTPIFISVLEYLIFIHRHVKAALIDIRKFFRIILFNFITLNDDAHLKNFSLIERGGEYRLPPAYDLINTSLQLRNPNIFALDKGLFKEGMTFSYTRTICRSDFEEFGRRIGLPPKVIKQDIDMFTAEQPLAKELISRSFLSQTLQNQYWMSFEYRRKILNF